MHFSKRLFVLMCIYAYMYPAASDSFAKVASLEQKTIPICDPVSPERLAAARRNTKCLPIRIENETEKLITLTIYIKFPPCCSKHTELSKLNIIQLVQAGYRGDIWLPTKWDNLEVSTQRTTPAVIEVQGQIFEILWDHHGRYSDEELLSTPGPLKFGPDATGKLALIKLVQSAEQKES